MIEVSIIYSGVQSSDPENFLNLLKIVHLEELTETNRFFLKETKFGQVTINPINLNINEPLIDKVDTNFLIYKFLSDEELNFLKHNLDKFKIYVLLHKYLSLSYVSFLIKEFGDVLVFIGLQHHDQYLQNTNELKKRWPNINSVSLLKPKNKSLKERNGINGSITPMFILKLLRFVTTPLLELKRYAIILQYSNLRVLNRLLEFIFFIIYVFHMLLFQPFFELIRSLYWLGFKILGSGYVLLIKSVFLSRNILVYKIYYFFKYNVRHFILILIYKSYGIMVDTINFLMRFAIQVYNFIRYILIWPLRKLWWFSHFQYNKRLKKYFIND